MDKNDHSIMERYENEVLAPIVKEFELGNLCLPDLDIVKLNNTVNELVKRAFIKFLDVAELTAFTELNDNLKAELIFFTISAFNNALPPDCPYIIVIICFKDVKIIQLTVIMRKLISGIHDCLLKNIVPIVLLNSEEDIKNGELPPLKVEFKGLNSEFLENDDQK